MTGLPATPVFALFLQFGQIGIIVSTALSRFNFNTQRHIKLTEQELLGGHMYISLWKITKVNNIPIFKRLFAIMFTNVFLLLLREDTGSLLSMLPQNGDLLPQII